MKVYALLLGVADIGSHLNTEPEQESRSPGEDANALTTANTQSFPEADEFDDYDGMYYSTLYRAVY